MTKRSILSLACKVVGIVFLAQAVAAIPRVVQYVMMLFRGSFACGGQPTAHTLLFIGGLLLDLGIASILIGASDRISRVLLREDREAALPDVREQGRGILELACRVVGIVLLAQVMPALVRLFAESLIREAMVAGSGSRARDVVANTALSMRATEWASLIGYGATILIGLCLIFLAGRLSALLYPVPRNSGEDA